MEPFGWELAHMEEMFLERLHNGSALEESQKIKTTKP